MAAVFHIKAVSNILASCGPEAFQRQPLLNAFDAARATLVSTLCIRTVMTLYGALDPAWLTHDLKGCSVAAGKTKGLPRRPRMDLSAVGSRPDG